MNAEELLAALRELLVQWPAGIPLGEVRVQSGGTDVGLKSRGKLSRQQRDAVVAAGFLSGNAGYWYFQRGADRVSTSH